jgi:adenine-specific DNA glycosylase
VENFVHNNKQPLLNRVSSRDLNQAIMDFGSMVCKSRNPLCSTCVLEKNCEKNIVKIKKSKETFSGSNRELRGALLKLLLNENIASLETIQKNLKTDKVKLLKAVSTLEKDGLITIKKNNLVEINS